MAIIKWHMIHPITMPLSFVYLHYISWCHIYVVYILRHLCIQAFVIPQKLTSISIDNQTSRYTCHILVKNNYYIMLILVCCVQIIFCQIVRAPAPYATVINYKILENGWLKDEFQITQASSHPFDSSKLGKMKDQPFIMSYVM